jgi:glycosyltransferase involved in cell wall biosynthesis
LRLRPPHASCFTRNALMKLLFFNHNVAWSGTFFRAFHLGRELVQHGYQTTVVTTSRSARLQPRRQVRDGVELIEMPDLFWGRGRTGWDPWNLFHRTLRLEVGPIDAIHAFDCRPAVILPALYHARSSNAPLFVDWADWWGRGGSIVERQGWMVNRLIGGVETWFEEAFRTHAVGTTVITRALEQRAISLGVAPHTILRFPHGCDADCLRPQPRELARERLGIAPETGIILHVGNIYPADWDQLRAAMRVVVAARPNTRLVMLGNPSTYIARNALPAGALITPGFVDFATMQAWLAAANACAVPLRDTVSGRGRWPSKVGDYMCAARAVVMPRIGDAARCVDSVRAGWTCEPQPDAFAAALLTALESPAEADAAGARGRVLAETELAWPTLAHEVNAFYRRTLQRAGTPAAARAGVGVRQA